MNPQMQNYQRYAQAQAQRAPQSTRRQGECDSSTSIPSTQGADGNGNPTGLAAPATAGPGQPDLVTNMPNVPHPPPYYSPRRQPSVSSFSTPHTSGRARNNDTPVSSDDDSHPRLYTNIWPSPARVSALKLKFSRTPATHTPVVRSPDISISSDKDDESDFPDCPTPSRGPVMDFNNSGRTPASRFQQGPPLFAPGIRAPGLRAPGLNASIQPRVPALNFQQGPQTSAMDIDSQRGVPTASYNQGSFGPGMDSNNQPRLPATGYQNFNNQSRLPATGYQQGLLASNKKFSNQTGTPATGFQQAALGSNKNFNNQTGMPAPAYKPVPLDPGLVDPRINFNQTRLPTAGLQQGPPIPGTNFPGVNQTGIPAPQPDEGALDPPSPRTRRHMQVRAEMAQAQTRNYARLGYPNVEEESNLRFMNTVPNQHANIAAQQHQQQLYQQQMAQRNAALEHQLAQRRAKKPTDLNMPEGLEDIVIGDGVQQYKALREAEKRLDYTMMRKRLDIEQLLNRNQRRQKTMRIWINNTCANQPWQRPPMDAETFDFNSGEDSTFELEVRGKIIDPDSDSDDDSDLDEEEKAERAKRPKPAPKKFMHYFKAISVDYEIHQQNPNMPIDPSCKIDWKKNPQKDVSDVDCIAFKRPGDENQNITINLVRDEPVERYRLSTALANTLDIEEADRAEVVMGIWEYVKAMGLQEDDERRLVRCDEQLKSIFNTDAFLFPQVAERIMPHLHPLPPVKLPYTIHVDEAFQSTVTETNPRFTIYDVKITVEDPLRAKILAITQSSKSLANIRRINDLNDQLAVIIQAIHHHKAKYDFFKAFSRDPVGFLKKWHASQQRDLSIILGEMDRGDVDGLEFAKGGADGVWGSEVVQEAVRYKLAKGDAMR